MIRVSKYLRLVMNVYVSRSVIFCSGSWRQSSSRRAHHLQHLSGFAQLSQSNHRQGFAQPDVEFSMVTNGASGYFFNKTVNLGSRCSIIRIRTINTVITYVLGDIYMCDSQTILELLKRVLPLYSSLFAVNQRINEKIET